MLPANEIKNIHNYKARTSQKPLDVANITSTTEAIYTLYKVTDKSLLMMPTY